MCRPGKQINQQQRQKKKQKNEIPVVGNILFHEQSSARYPYTSYCAVVMKCAAMSVDVGWVWCKISLRGGMEQGGCCIEGAPVLGGPSQKLLATICSTS